MPIRRQELSSGGASQALWERCRSGFLDLPGLLAATLSVVLEDECDLVAFVQRLDPRQLECGCMDEHIFRSVLGCDEAKAFGGIVELERSRDSH
jgi:hypothetical protein